MGYCYMMTQKTRKKKKIASQNTNIRYLLDKRPNVRLWIKLSKQHDAILLFSDKLFWFRRLIQLLALINSVST